MHPCCSQVVWAVQKNLSVFFFSGAWVGDVAAGARSRVFCAGGSPLGSTQHEDTKNKSIDICLVPGWLHADFCSTGGLASIP